LRLAPVLLYPKQEETHISCPHLKSRDVVLPGYPVKKMVPLDRGFGRPVGGDPAVPLFRNIQK
jgi:hypothetical protein